jgi:UDP-2-acetamido-3-amino-2,3-dideoxy-glucuronate N-acetyltransferase
MQFMEAVETYADSRGSLTIFDPGFPIARVYFVREVPDFETVRGNHAHRSCQQFLVCMNGSLRVIVESLNEQEPIRATLSAGEAIRIDPLQWARQYGFTNDAILLVLCSHAYDPDDYIRDRKVWEALA